MRSEKIGNPQRGMWKPGRPCGAGCADTGKNQPDSGAYTLVEETMYNLMACEEQCSRVRGLGRGS